MPLVHKWLVLPSGDLRLGDLIRLWRVCISAVVEAFLKSLELFSGSLKNNLMRQVLKRTTRVARKTGHATPPSSASSASLPVTHSQPVTSGHVSHAVTSVTCGLDAKNSEGRGAMCGRPVQKDVAGDAQISTWSQQLSAICSWVHHPPPSRVTESAPRLRPTSRDPLADLGDDARRPGSRSPSHSTRASMTGAVTERRAPRSRTSSQLAPQLLARPPNLVIVAVRSVRLHALSPTTRPGERQRAAPRDVPSRTGDFRDLPPTACHSSRDPRSRQGRSS